MKGRLRRGLSASIAIVALAGLVAEWIGFRPIGQSNGVQKAVAFFSLSQEHNLPSWFSSTLLFACAIVLGSVAASLPGPSSTAGERASGRYRRHWWVLAIGFGYMSLDEAVELHEHLGGLFTLHGVLYFSWVVPAALVVLLVCASYVGFLRALPVRTRRRFVIAGVIYVGGAVGMELPLGWWTEHHGDENFGYALIDWVEETLEMIGAALFLVSVLEHRAATSASGPAGEAS